MATVLPVQSGSSFKISNENRREIVIYSMPSDGDKRNTALDAAKEELWSLIKMQDPAILSNVLLNRNLTEEMAAFIARSKRTAPEDLGLLCNDIRFKNSYKIKVAVCKNPKTPQKATLSLLKFIKIFDLADISRDQFINISIRQKIEHIFSERIPSMPSGIKTALARRVNCNILLMLMECGDEPVIAECLNNPVFTEAHIYKVINRSSTSGIVIKMIAEHQKWALRHSVKFALIRNFHTPMRLAVKFIEGMKVAELKDLFSDPKLPVSSRHFIYRELLERGDTADSAEEVYALAEDEDVLMPDSEEMKE